MQTKQMLLTVGVAASAFLAGCAHMVSFTSEPTGATVTYKDRTIGTTPFAWEAHDDFGWFSVYSFTATLEGYQPATLVYKEEVPSDAAGVVPKDIHFDLKK